MVAGQQTEVVEVIGSAIAVDTTSTAVFGQLDRHVYQSVPVARASPACFLLRPVSQQAAVREQPIRRSPAGLAWKITTSQTA